MDTPLISVILATYNGSRFLWEAIESVLYQDYNNLELIVIDDSSTDIEVWNILERYKKEDSRISSYRNDKNMERSYSKNLWVTKALWEYIAFIDDDDIWHARKLSKQMISLRKDTNLAIIWTHARFIDEWGKILWETNHLKINPKDISENILFTNQFIHSSVVLKKEVFLSVWGFSTVMNLCEDYDLWLRILSSSFGTNIWEPLVNYRVRAMSTTAHNVYRMKYYSLLLTWKYRKNFPWFFQAFWLRIILFPIPTVFIMKVWNRLFHK